MTTYLECGRMLGTHIWAPTCTKIWVIRVTIWDKNHTICDDCVEFYGFLIEWVEMIKMSAPMLELCRLRQVCLYSSCVSQDVCSWVWRVGSSVECSLYFEVSCMMEWLNTIMSIKPTHQHIGYFTMCWVDFMRDCVNASIWRVDWRNVKGRQTE